MSLPSRELKQTERMEKIVSLCKSCGFIFQSSEVYGGINGFWDYGPLGVELKRNIKELWWRSMTKMRDDVVGLDASIIMHPTVWKASGHIDTFADPMVDCLLTKKRYRADQVEPQTGMVYRFSGAWDPTLAESVVDGWSEHQQSLTAWLAETLEREITVDMNMIPADPKTAEIFKSLRHNSCAVSLEPFSVLLPAGKPPESARKVAIQFYAQRGLKAPVLLGERTEHVENSTRYNPENGSLLTEPRMFNLMFKTHAGPVESDENVVFLRPETAQAIFVQFKNVVATSRQKVPFGIAQIGKAFRNEINPRNYTFRSREFEQMELEFFIKPDEVIAKQAGNVATVVEGEKLTSPQPNWGWEAWHSYWVAQRLAWYESIGLSLDTLELYWQKPEELAHYARATVDILYKFPFGTQELEGIAARGNYDLMQHQTFSGKSMEYFDQETNSRYVPHVIEPSAGADRLVLALLCNAYAEEEVADAKGAMDTRVVMRFHPRVAPIKVGIFPLIKNKPALVEKAIAVRDLLRPFMNVFYDETGAIGRRYRRQDEIGTPFGVTIDFDTIGENGPELTDTVTLRHRDSMKQERVKISELMGIILPQIQ